MFESAFGRPEKKEKYEIISEWQGGDGKNYRRVRTRNTPARIVDQQGNIKETDHGEHEFEIEYVEIPPHYDGGPTGWLKVYEKDLGHASKEK